MINNFKQIVEGNIKNFKEEALKNISQTIVGLEEEFHRTNVSTLTWHVKDRRIRRLWTPIGDIIISRRIYENKYTKESAILFDKSIGLVLYLYIQPAFFPMFINILGKVRSYNSLAEIMVKGFSSTQILNILKGQDVSIELKP